MSVVDKPADTVSTRDKILILEDAMRRMPQVEIPPVHYFAKGLYAREILVPKGTLITGMLHATETIGVMSKGSMVIVNEDGSRVIVNAPYTHVGKVGWKRVGYALEDVVWTTIHKTELMDLLEIEKEQFIADDSDRNMFDFATGKVKHTPIKDRHDFFQMLQEYGYDPKTVREQSENTADMFLIEMDQHGITLGTSQVEGTGVFPTRPFRNGEVVGPARLNGFRTQLGRYVNHSSNPNARMTLADHGDIMLVLTQDITQEEITTDYRHTLALSGVVPVGIGGTKCPA